jgi:hypothetical protein
MRGHGVDVQEIRVVDHDVRPGVSTDMGDGARGRASTTG